MKETTASICILAAIFLWSSLGVVVRLSGVEIHILIFYGLIVSLSVQGLILSTKQFRKEIPALKDLKYAFLLGVVGLMNTFSFFYAFKNTTIANAVLTHYTAPVIVAFLAPFFLKESITKKIIFAILLASAGLLIMLNGFSLTGGHTAGIIAGTFSGFTYAFIIIIIRAHTKDYHPLVFSFFSNMVMAIILLPFIREFPVKSLWFFLMYGIVHSTIAPLLYFKGLKYVSANKTAVLGYLEPVSAIIFSMIFLKEQPGMNSIIGGALIIFSGYLTLKNGSQVSKPANSIVQKLIFLFCSSVLLIFCSSGVLAADKLELTLSEAINTALGENLQITDTKITSKIAEADIKVKEGEFDPSAGLSAGERYKKSPSISPLYGTEDKKTNADISLAGKISTGTKYELKWTNERSKSNLGFLMTNPYYTSELAFTLTQPLLKGIGKDVQESSLNVSRNNFEISRLDLDDRAISIIADTTLAYWDLAFARHDVEVAELSLNLAKNLLDEVKAKIDAGMLAPVEIYKAEAEVSQREENLIKAKKLVVDATDKLRILMNSKNWLVELIPIEKVPTQTEIMPVEKAVETAFNNRKDYKKAALALKNKEILKKYFDNQKYPDLNVVGAVGLNGLNGSYNSAFNRMTSRDFYSWQFGLSLVIPLGNNISEGNYLKAKYEEERSINALKLIEQKVVSEVREAWRASHLASETIQTTKKTRIASEKRLEAEQGRFKVGMAILNDVLKFQEEYAKALSAEKRAEIEYAKALTGLEKATGAIGLPSNKI